MLSLWTSSMTSSCFRQAHHPNINNNSNLHPLKSSNTQLPCGANYPHALGAGKDPTPGCTEPASRIGRAIHKRPRAEFVSPMQRMAALSPM